MYKLKRIWILWNEFEFYDNCVFKQYIRDILAFTLNSARNIDGRKRRRDARQVCS